MNKEQIIDEAYENYNNYMLENFMETRWCKVEISPDGRSITGRKCNRDEFVIESKTQPGFSEKWGLKIEERELSLEERRILWNKKVDPSENACEYVDGLSIVDAHDIFNQDNVSTKLITLTYNNETIESYE
jgi:hypothetical protein